MDKGDFVKLKTDDIAMVVISIDGGQATCVWCEGERCQSGKFSIDALEPTASLAARGMTTRPL